ncbi:MAG: type II secretion system protein GspH [Moraxellaceae bacterium]|nr:MAG: type II secretion system protein GspH [Moraxellaceae bacterium]
MTSQPLTARIVKGFTMIEIMVVMIIIGIMTAAVALNVAPNDPARNLKKEAVRFVAVVAQAVDEATFQQRELGIVTTEDGYKFIRYEKLPPPATVAGAPPPPAGPRYGWKLIEGNNTLREYQISEGVRFLLELEESQFMGGQSGTTNGETELTRTNLNLDDIGPELDGIGPDLGEENIIYVPEVYISPSGEMIPFIAEFFLESDSDISLLVKGDELGRVKIDYGDDFER